MTGGGGGGFKGGDKGGQAGKGGKGIMSAERRRQLFEDLDRRSVSSVPSRRWEVTVTGAEETQEPRPKRLPCAAVGLCPAQPRRAFTCVRAVGLQMDRETLETEDELSGGACGRRTSSQIYLMAPKNGQHNIIYNQTKYILL